MTTSTSTRFLQQESLRLRKQTETLEQNQQFLYDYFALMEQVYWATQSIASAENPLDMLNHLLHTIITTIGAQDGSLSRLNNETGELVFLLVHGALQDKLRGYRIHSDAGIAGWVVSNNKPLIINHPRQDWRFSQQVDETFQFMTQSIITVPVMLNGQLLGVNQLLNKPSGFDEADQTLLLFWSNVAAQAFVEIDRRIMTGEATMADYLDGLTDLTVPQIDPTTEADTVSSFEDPTFAATFFGETVE